MTTTSPSLAHKELITKHTNLSHMTQYGRVSARKQSGQYIVTVEDFETQHTSRMSFKTMRGCLIAFDEAKRMI